MSVGGLRVAGRPPRMAGLATRSTPHSIAPSHDDLALLRPCRPGSVGDFRAFRQVSGRALLQGQQRCGAAGLHRADRLGGAAVHLVPPAGRGADSTAGDRRHRRRGPALHGRDVLLPAGVADGGGVRRVAVLPGLAAVRLWAWLCRAGRDAHGGAARRRRADRDRRGADLGAARRCEEVQGAPGRADADLRLCRSRSPR